MGKIHDDFMVGFFRGLSGSEAVQWEGPELKAFSKECIPHLQAIIDIAAKHGIMGNARVTYLMAFIAGDAVHNGCPRKVFREKATYAFDFAKNERKD